MSSAQSPGHLKTSQPDCHSCDCFIASEAWCALLALVWSMVQELVECRPRFWTRRHRKSPLHNCMVSEAWCALSVLGLINVIRAGGMQARYLQEAAQRRALHNQLVDLKGAIRVFCRVRPLLARERVANLEAATSCHPLDNTITVVGNRYAAAGKLCNTFISCDLLDVTPS